MASGTIKNFANNSGANYCKMPDGTLIQWGIATTALNNVWLTATLSFSVAFVGTYCVFATGSQNASAYTTSPWFDCNTAGNITHSATSATISAKGTNANGNVNYLAIGRWK